jgi:hypothetical protein
MKGWNKYCFLAASLQLFSLKMKKIFVSYRFCIKDRAIRPIVSVRGA